MEQASIVARKLTAAEHKWLVGMSVRRVTEADQRGEYVATHLGWPDGYSRRALCGRTKLWAHSFPVADGDSIDCGGCLSTLDKMRAVAGLVVGLQAKARQ